jgi:hypothetical protein
MNAATTRTANKEERMQRWEVSVQRALMCVGLGIAALTGCQQLLTDGDVQEKGSASRRGPRDLREGGRIDAIECTVLHAIRELDPDGPPSPGWSEDVWSCELYHSDAGGNHGQTLLLEGLPADFIRRHREEMSSGRAKLRFTGAYGRNGKLVIPPHAVGDLQLVPAAAAAAGTAATAGSSEGTDAADGEIAAGEIAPANTVATTLALRVQAPDSVPTVSADEIRRSVFGGDGDEVNLASQYDACSHGQHQFVAATGTNIVGGVMEVSVSIDAATSTWSDMMNAAQQVADQQLGGSVSQFDHVMFCLPPGLPNWGIALAYLNNYRSIYNNEWCTYVSTQMHEVGHNYGRHHAGEGTNSYGDQSGMMGYSYSQNEGPEMCFNAARSSDWGWYGTRENVFDFNTSASWSGQLIGLTDFDLSSPEHTVVLRIPRPNSGLPTVHMTYNVAEDFNVGTKEFQNRVTIVEATPTTTSNVLASLGVGESYQFPYFDGSDRDLTISVTSQTTELGVDISHVEISAGAGCVLDADCDNGLPCDGVETCDLNNGTCVSGPAVVCDDGNYCNGLETCDPGTGQCVDGTDPCNETPSLCRAPMQCDETVDTCLPGDLIPDCCGNDVCEAGEDCTSCGADCIGGTFSVSECGNGVCEQGEDCFNCGADCASRMKGKRTNRYCCVGGSTPTSSTRGGVSCDERAECNLAPYSCTTVPDNHNYCCGDGFCTAGYEDGATCTIDCPI